MSKRLTRKQIKEDIRHDDFQAAVTSTVDNIASHRKLAIWTVVGLLTAAILVSVVVAWSKSRDESASLALAQAIKIYEAPIVESDAEPDDPDAPSFAGEDDRKAKARAAFEEVSGGVAEDVASLYLAEIAFGEGDKESARAAWESFRDEHSGSGHALAVSVERNLIRLDREEGKGGDVVTRLEAELGSQTKSLPEDLLLYELAETLESLDRGEEAETYYQRILDDYPSSSFAAKARQKTTS